MATFREYNTYKEAFEVKIKNEILALKSLGFDVPKHEVEFCLYDTKNNHDYLWLKKESELKVKSVDFYLDGGTMEINTNKGTYIYPGVRDEPNYRKLCKGSMNHSNLVDDEKFEVELLEALKEFKDPMFDDAYYKVVMAWKEENE